MLDKYFPLYVVAFLLSLSVTLLAERRLIPALSKKAKQPIYTEGPSWHEKKSGTPTMGGIAFILALLLSSAPALLIFLSLPKQSLQYTRMYSSSLTLLNTLRFTVRFLDSRLLPATASTYSLFRTRRLTLSQVTLTHTRFPRTIPNTLSPTHSLLRLLRISLDSTLNTLILFAATMT